MYLLQLPNSNSRLRCLLIVTALVMTSVIASAYSSIALSKEPNQNVRFYKINKQQQWTKLLFTGKKGRQAGCHNLLTKKRVHRFNQFGYRFCTLHQAKDCSEESVIKSKREKDKPEQIELQQGFSWYPVGDHERGVKIASWYCET